MANAYGLPDNNILSSFLMTGDATERGNALRTQNMAGQIGILGALQQQAARRKAVEDEAALRDALARGDIPALQRSKEGIGLLNMLSEMQHRDAARSRLNADAELKATDERRNQASVTRLTDLLTRPEPGFENTTGSPVRMFQNEQELAQAAAEHERANSGVPFLGQVNNPQKIRAAVAGAGNNIPATTGREILRSLAPTQTGFTNTNRAPVGYRFTQDGSLEPIPGGPAIRQDGGSPRAPAGYRFKPDGSLEPIPGGPAARSSSDKPKPPAGFRYTDNGDLEPIPGGPADTKVRGQFNVDSAILTSSEQNLNRLAEAAKALKDHPGLTRATGAMSIVPLYGGAATIPGTDPADFKAQLDTLKSQVGFSVLNDMRAASKTGGALGQITERELTFLQNNLGALDRAQSVKSYKDALQKIIDFTAASKGRLATSFNLKYKGAKPATEGAPTTQNVLDQADAILRGQQ